MAVAAGTGLLAAGGMVAALGPAPSSASSHREAPLIAGDPQADNTDLYAFTSPDRPDTVTLVANWIPFQEPNGGPNFYPFATHARYNIKIDNDGDAEPDITYRWTFRNEDRRGNKTFLYNNGPVTSLRYPNLLFRQHYTLQRITRKGNPDAGPGRHRRALADRRRVHARLRQAAQPGDHPGPGRRPDFRRSGRRPVLPRPARLRPALRREPQGDRERHPARLQRQHHRAAGPQERPRAGAQPGRNPVIGIWSTTDRRGASAKLGHHRTGGYHQVSRLGNPLVNEVIS